MRIYTSTVYGYDGKDKADVTRGSGSGWGKEVAPPWFLVNGLKAGKLTEKQYTRLYLLDLAISLKTHPDIGQKLLDTYSHDDEITLVCYCKPGAFCHRVLLARWLEEQGCGEYMGEREIVTKDKEDTDAHNT